MSEYERLGKDRGPIDEVLKEYNVNGLSDLDPSSYLEVLEKVKQK